MDLVGSAGALNGNPTSTPQTSAADYLLRRAEAKSAFQSAKGDMRTDPAAPPIASGEDNHDGGFSFLDLVDVLNPLQHIPGVGTIYRAITNDTIKPATSFAGGALYGGPLGGAIALASSVFGELFSASAAEPAAKAIASNPAQPDIFKIS